MITANLHTIKARIAQLSQHYGVPAPQLLAVSKKHHLSAIESVIAEGQQHFGESYVQETIEKITTLNDPNVTWHFIGPIQSNKTKAIATHFDWAHSVDSEKIAQRLNDQHPDNLQSLKIFLQINIDRGLCTNPISVHFFVKISLKVLKYNSHVPLFSLILPRTSLAIAI